MNNDTQQTILIIDDHPLFRKGLIQLIQSADEFDILGEASGGKEGIASLTADHSFHSILDQE